MIWSHLGTYTIALRAHPEKIAASLTPFGGYLGVTPYLWIGSKKEGMILLAQFMGALYGLLAIIFGAFGAHALKKKFTAEQLQSFETGVKYQMYHAIILLVLGYNFGFAVPLESYIAYCFMIGTFLFSFSIYGLCLSAAQGRKMRFLGPVTPLGGLFLVIGWALLLYSFVADFI